LKTSESVSKVLLIGGSGFIGSVLLKTLRAAGLSVQALYHRTPISDPEVMLIHGDLRDFNWDGLSDFPDVIIHCGRISARSWPGRVLAGWQGERANKRLIEWLKRCERTPKLVFLSGTLVYGSNGDVEIDEDAPFKPVGFQKFYARAEQPILQSLSTTDLPVNIIRVPWVMGNASWFKQFYVRPIKEMGYVPVFGEGENAMSVVHIEDCARFIMHVALSSTKPGIINMAVLDSVTQREFCQTIASIANVPLRSIPLHKLKGKYGKTVTEALTFSLNLISNRPEIDSYLPRFNTVHEVITDVWKNINMKKND